MKKRKIKPYFTTFKAGDVVRLRSDANPALFILVGRNSYRVISVINGNHQLEEIGGDRCFNYILTMRYFELDRFMTAAANATEDGDGEE